MSKSAQIVVILGSESDLKHYKESKVGDIFNVCQIPYETSIFSADRHPLELEEYCCRKQKEGARVFIAIAGLSAILPGKIAALVERPVLGVALGENFMSAIDAVTAIVQKPIGAPAAALCGAVGKAGIFNAAIIACKIIAISDGDVVCHFLSDYLKKIKVKCQENIDQPS